MRFIKHLEATMSLGLTTKSTETYVEMLSKTGKTFMFCETLFGNKSSCDKVKIRNEMLLFSY